MRRLDFGPLKGLRHGTPVLISERNFLKGTFELWVQNLCRNGMDKKFILVFMNSNQTHFQPMLIFKEHAYLGTCRIAY